MEWSVLFCVGIGVLLVALGVWTLCRASSFTEVPWWWRPTLWATGLLHGREMRRKIEQRLSSPGRIRIDGIMWIVGGILFIVGIIVWWFVEMFGVGGR